MPKLSSRYTRILSILSRVNVPSKDDGHKFTVTDRADAIRDLLLTSGYRLVHDGDLSLVYARDGFAPADGFILISCHIDSLYSTHFHRDLACDEILGTFDNSICNAILVEMLLQESLPPNVLVAFTGDEEGDVRGADDVLAFVQRQWGSLANLELVITLDITSEAYGTRHYTVENILLGDRQFRSSRLSFNDRYQFGSYVRDCLQDDDCHMLFDADPDESERYSEYGLTCITFCIPTRPHPDNASKSVGSWMHDDKGVVARKQDTVGFAHALETLCRNISRL